MVKTFKHIVQQCNKTFQQWRDFIQQFDLRLECKPTVNNNTKI